jgi:hypothetical protein
LDVGENSKTALVQKQDSSGTTEAPFWVIDDETVENTSGRWTILVSSDGITDGPFCNSVIVIIEEKDNLA